MCWNITKYFCKFFKVIYKVLKLFKASELTCKSLCEMPALPTEATIDAISEEIAREKEIYRCLEPLKTGDCTHR